MYRFISIGCRDEIRIVYWAHSTFGKVLSKKKKKLHIWNIIQNRINYREPQSMERWFGKYLISKKCKSPKCTSRLSVQEIKNYCILFLLFRENIQSISWSVDNRNNKNNKHNMWVEKQHKKNIGSLIWRKKPPSDDNLSSI